MDQLTFKVESSNNEFFLKGFLDSKEIGYIKGKAVKEKNLIEASKTLVYKEYEGHGYARLLLDELVKKAREKGYKINPVCSYIKHNFEKDPLKYKDVKF